MPNRTQQGGTAAPTLLLSGGARRPRRKGQSAGQIALHAAHGDAVVLLRKAVSARLRTHAGGHVDLAALHRRAPHGTAGRGAVRRRGFWHDDAPRGLLRFFAAQDGFVDYVHVRPDFVVPV